MDKWNDEKVASFSYHLYTMLQSDIALLDSLQMLTTGNIISSRDGQILMQTIQKGESLSTAFRSIDLPVVFCSFIEVAEHHGDILFALKQSHRYFEARAKWLHRLKQVTFYPLFILCILCVGLLFLSVIVLPTFSELYRSFAFPLPYTTRIVFAFAKVFPYVLAISLLLLACCYLMRKKTSFQALVHRIPLITTYYRYRYTQYLSMQLGSFMLAGVPMLSSFRLLEQVAPWPDLRMYLHATKERLITGETLAMIVQQTPKELLPIFSQTVLLGEETGKVGEMLTQLAMTTEEWMTAKLERWMTLLEPILTLSIGLIMAVVVISLFLPMFGLIQAVQ